MSNLETFVKAVESTAATEEYSNEVEGAATAEPTKLRQTADFLKASAASSLQVVSSAAGQATAAAKEPVRAWRSARAQAAASILELPVAVSGVTACAKSVPEIIVSDPEQMGDGMNKYTVYKVTSSEANLSVARRYSDFSWLQSELWKEAHRGVIVPALPAKTSLWRFDHVVIETRRRALQNFLMRIATHPVLCTCQAFKSFLGSDEDQLRTLKEGCTESLHTGLCVWATAAATTVADTTLSLLLPSTSPDDCDESKQMAAAKDYVDNLQQELNIVFKHTASIVQSNDALATGTSKLASALRQLGEGDDAGLQKALSQLGNSAQDAATCTKAVALKQFLYFAEPLKFYTQMIGSVQKAMASQEGTRRLRDRALANVASKTASCAKLEGDDAKKEQAERGMAELATAKEAAAEAEKILHETTDLFLAELERFKQDKVADFRKLAEDFKQLQVEFHKQAAAAWEADVTAAA